MDVAARRVFRMALTVAVALAAAYALQLPLPFLAPLFAFVLEAKPGPPLGPKALLGLLVVVLVTLGVGLLLVPVLIHYPVSAVLIVALGVYFSAYVTINLRKGLVGTFLTVGITLISLAGLIDYGVAFGVIQALAIGIGLAVLSQWLIYPFFPEDTAMPAKPAVAAAPQSNWVALRATLIVLPVYLLALTNPSLYLPLIMKSVSLGQQDSVTDARHAGRELLGSTFLGGCYAVVFWVLLKIWPSLWMFFLWMLLFALYFAAKLFRVLASRYPPSFWVNVAITMLILLGSAVQDSATGKDVYQAFAVRMGLFIAVATYAGLAVSLLERLRDRRRKSQQALKTQQAMEPT